jgi:hypothetical protein
VSKKAKQGDLVTAVAEFEAYFPTVVKKLKHIVVRYERELLERHGCDVASIIKEILPKPKGKRGHPRKKFRMLDDDHSMLAQTIDDVLVPAHKKNGSLDPLKDAIEEATNLEALEGRPKSIETVRKYYWQGRRSYVPRKSNPK